MKPDFTGGQLTEEEKFLFDLQGFLIRPHVFDVETTAKMREQVIAMKNGEEVVPAPAGAAEAALLSPQIGGALTDLIGPDLRLDNLFTVVREYGGSDGQGPHQGGPMHNPHFHYHYTDGKIFSGLTRVVVELNDVHHGDGGTVFLPGSHKSNLHVPASLREKKKHYQAPFVDYEAPAGSVVFFSENTTHAGPDWTNRDHPRVSLFFSFCNIGMRWHRRSHIEPSTVEQLSPEARWWFRDIWPWDNAGGRGKGQNLVLIEDDGTLTVSP